MKLEYHGGLAIQSYLAAQQTAKDGRGSPYRSRGLGGQFVVNTDLQEATPPCLDSSRRALPGFRDGDSQSGKGERWRLTRKQASQALCVNASDRAGAGQFLGSHQ